MCDIKLTVSYLAAFGFCSHLCYKVNSITYVVYSENLINGARFIFEKRKTYEWLTYTWHDMYIYIMHMEYSGIFTDGAAVYAVASELLPWVLWDWIPHMWIICVVHKWLSWITAHFCLFIICCNSDTGPF